MPDSIYYNVKPAKLAPNALKTAKKCELPNSKLGTVSIKILKNHKMEENQMAEPLSDHFSYVQRCGWPEF